MKMIAPPTPASPSGKKASNCNGCRLFASLEALKWWDGKIYWICGNCMQFAKLNAKDIIKHQISWNEFRKQCLEYRFAKKKEGVIIKPHFTK